jgi:hypothetical protein
VAESKMTFLGDSSERVIIIVIINLLFFPLIFYLDIQQLIFTLAIIMSDKNRGRVNYKGRPQSYW